MGVNQQYGGLVWTNHALERLKSRGLPQDMAWEAFRNPDKTVAARNPDAKEFRKRFDKANVTVIAKQNEKNEWIILSCWVDPPFPGSVDWKNRENYHKLQKASFWGKMFLTLKQQLGL